MHFSDAIGPQSITIALGAMVDSGAGAPPTPPDILNFLARLRMLQGVPFNNLVPDSTLLPHESIRFFYLDRAWTDALVQGALSVATVNTVERAQLEALYPRIEAEVDATERSIRAPGGEALQAGSAGQVSGFLLRSAAVAGWPGLHVRAWKTEPGGTDETLIPESHPQRLKLLRLERLAPAVLLALFDGVPSVVHIEEPRQGVQFGIRMALGAQGRASAYVPARNVHSAGYVNAAGQPVATSQQAARIPVRFRKGVAGVIDMTNTARAFADAAGTGMSTHPADPIDGAEFALQMLRFPYRQVFAQSEATAAVQDEAFRPALGDTARAMTQALARKLREG